MRAAGEGNFLGVTVQPMVTLDGYELIGVGGPNAAHSAREVAAANDRDRVRGVVAAHGEFEHGVTEYAIPVRDTAGHIRAAVSVVGRQQDLTAHERTIRTNLTAAATALAEHLDGYDTPR